jgi:23S rRNA maturation-related 3'-5' exoribonuclease YhaM
MYKSITEEDISNLINLDYDEFIEAILIELVKHSDNNNLLPMLLEHLQNSDIKDDINQVLSKIRDSKINSILDERSKKLC